MMRYIFPLLLLVPGVAACGDSDPGGVPSIRIEGASMAPTFTNGAYVEVRTYEAPVQPGDIIVFHLPTRPEREVLKRVIAGPGQTVSINPAEGVAVDGARITEPYTQGETRCTFACQFDIPELVGGGPGVPDPDGEPIVYDPDAQSSYCAEAGCYFVMGDNRLNSSDSRQGWLVPLENIIGYVEERE